MKFFILLILSFPLISLGAPCNGASGKNHKNPDGSVGGFVAETASVSTTATVDASSSVCERARVSGNVKLRTGSEVSGQALIEGNTTVTGSRIYSQARVLGNSVVTGSVICQASEINFNVINSDYYCQTDDPEPKDPGELGKKTLLGIDSDVDGVRDDVEIWINNKASNTPEKNMYNVREALKQIAKDYQSNIKVKDLKSESIRISRQSLESLDCLMAFVPEEEMENFHGGMQVQIYNTMERLKAWAKTQGNMSGETIRVNSADKQKQCIFHVK